MTHTSDNAARFAARLSEAVRKDAHVSASATRASYGRHKHRRPAVTLFSPSANPARLRTSEDLFAERIRQALD